MVKQRDTIIVSLTEREQRLRAQDLINDLEQYSRKASIRITGLVVEKQYYLAEVINVFKSNLNCQSPQLIADCCAPATT